MKTAMPRTTAALLLALSAASLVACSAAPERAVIEENVRTYTTTVAEAAVKESTNPMVRVNFEHLDKPLVGDRSWRDMLEADGRRYCAALARGIAADKVVDTVWSDAGLDSGDLDSDSAQNAARAARLAGEILCPASDVGGEAASGGA